MKPWRIARFAQVINPVFDERLRREPGVELRVAPLAKTQADVDAALEGADVYHVGSARNEMSALTRAIEAWAKAQGLQMQRIVASNSVMAIVGLTLADIGVSFLPQPFVRPWVERKLLVSLRSNPPLPVLPYCFLHRSDDARSMFPLLLKCVAEEADFTFLAGVVAAKSKND